MSNNQENKYIPFPDKALTGYELFCMDMDKGPEQGESTRKLNRMWKNMSMGEIFRYTAMESIDKTYYIRNVCILYRKTPGIQIYRVLTRNNTTMDVNDDELEYDEEKNIYTSWCELPENTKKMYADLEATLKTPEYNSFKKDNIIKKIYEPENIKLWCYA